MYKLYGIFIVSIIAYGKILLSKGFFYDYKGKLGKSAMTRGLFILEQKRPRLQNGSWRIQFNVHIYQRQRSKKK